MDDNRNRLQNEAYPDPCPGEVTRREFLRGCGNKQLFEAELQMKTLMTMSLIAKNKLGI